jgi:hypothetical protein
MVFFSYHHIKKIDVNYVFSGKSSAKADDSTDNKSDNPSSQPKAP